MNNQWYEGMDKFPLAALTKKLELAPPSLRAILDQIADGELISEFFQIVRDYLPEYERELSRLPTEERVALFISRFGERYFPLAHGLFDYGYEGSEAYWYIVTSIPIDRNAITYEEYHDFDSLPPGFHLLATLVTCPFMGEEGTLVSIRENAADQTSMALVRRIPSIGWEPDHLATWLKDTKYSVVGTFAKYLHRDTGSPWLDMSYEDEGYGDLVWEKDLIEYMKEQWALTDIFWKEIHDLSERLQKKPWLLQEIVELIEEKSMETPLTREHSGKPLVEVFGGDEDREIRIRVPG